MRCLTELRVLLSGQSGQAQILGLFFVDYGNTRLCSVLLQKELSKAHCSEQHQHWEGMPIEDGFWQLFPKFTREHLQSKGMLAEHCQKAITSRLKETAQSLTNQQRCHKLTAIRNDPQIDSCFE